MAQFKTKAQLLAEILEQPSRWRTAPPPTSAVRDFRKARGLTQEQLARAAGVTQVHVSDVERGRRRLTPKAAMKLAGPLQTTPGPGRRSTGERLIHEALNGHQRSQTTHTLSQGSAPY